MSNRNSGAQDLPPQWWTRDDVAHLLTEASPDCWWCRERPATTGEHKFKASDLRRLMDGDALVWGDPDSGDLRVIRGNSGITRDRHGVLKFPKSMCETCNNARSQPFDKAYETFSNYLSEYWVRISAGIGFQTLYGPDWEESLLDLARYFAKHMGCRMVRSGLPVPDSLRDFLDGAHDMPDAHMIIVTTDTVHKRYRRGLYLSPDFITTDPGCTHFTSYVMATYTGSIGIRYEWRLEGMPGRSQFFHYPRPVLNCFRDENDVAFGRPRRPGWFARLSQWATRPRPERTS